MTPMSNTSNGKLLWILDNGHGVDTPGKRSPVLMDGRQFGDSSFRFFQSDSRIPIFSTVTFSLLKSFAFAVAIIDNPSNRPKSKSPSFNLIHSVVSVRVEATFYPDVPVKFPSFLFTPQCLFRVCWLPVDKSVVRAGVLVERDSASRILFSLL